MTPVGNPTFSKPANEKLKNKSVLGYDSEGCPLLAENKDLSEVAREVLEKDVISLKEFIADYEGDIKILASQIAVAVEQDLDSLVQNIKGFIFNRDATKEILEKLENELKTRETDSM